MRPTRTSSEESFFPGDYAGLGLPQGPFLENYLFPLKVGLRWVFVNGLKWVQQDHLVIFLVFSVKMMSATSA